MSKAKDLLNQYQQVNEAANIQKVIMDKTDFTNKEYDRWLRGGGLSASEKALDKIIQQKLDRAHIKHDEGTVEDMSQFGIKEDDWYDYLDKQGI